jgi:hypothetical protein
MEIWYPRHLGSFLMFKYFSGIDRKLERLPWFSWRFGHHQAGGQFLGQQDEGLRGEIVHTDSAKGNWEGVQRRR